MGTDKAFLDFKSQSLLERALHTLRVLTPEVMIVGQRTKFEKFAPVVEDVFLQRGPLGGIHAALTASATDLNLMLAETLPCSQIRFCKSLVNRSHSRDG